MKNAFLYVLLIVASLFFVLGIRQLFQDDVNTKLIGVFNILFNSISGIVLVRILRNQ